MTNLEWIKNDDKKLEEFLGLAVNEVTGEMTKCINMPCSLCLFHSSKNDEQPCRVSFRKWLNKEHQPLYKKGDAVLTRDDYVYLVISDRNLESHIAVSNNIFNLDTGIGVLIDKDDIKRKIGNIYKDTISDIAYEIVGDYIKKEV